jgi:hypothetical protein
MDGLGGRARGASGLVWREGFLDRGWQEMMSSVQVGRLAPQASPWPRAPYATRRSLLPPSAPRGRSLANASVITGDAAVKGGAGRCHPAAPAAPLQPPETPGRTRFLRRRRRHHDRVPGAAAVRPGLPHGRPAIPGRRAPARCGWEGAGGAGDDGGGWGCWGGVACHASAGCTLRRAPCTPSRTYTSPRTLVCIP